MRMLWLSAMEMLGESAFVTQNIVIVYIGTGNDDKDTAFLSSPAQHSEVICLYHKKIQ